MFSRRRKKKVLPYRREHLVIDGHRFFCNFYLEARPTARVTVGKSVHIRIPLHLSKRARESCETDLFLWAKHQIEKRLEREAPSYNPLRKKHIKILGEDRNLNILLSSRKTVGIVVESSQITIKLPAHWHKEELSVDQKKELLKKMIKPFLPQVEMRLDTYRKQLNIKERPPLGMRYLTSRWGSCSSKGGISLAIQLCLMPLEILDYVIVHELVHMMIKNHSSRFWQKVESILPDYSKKKAWLRKNGKRFFI